MTILISVLPPNQRLRFTDLGLIHATGQGANIDEAHEIAQQQLEVAAERIHADAVFGVQPAYSSGKLYEVTLIGSAVKFSKHGPQE